MLLILFKFFCQFWKWGPELKKKSKCLNFNFIFNFDSLNVANGLSQFALLASDATFNIHQVILGQVQDRLSLCQYVCGDGLSRGKRSMLGFVLCMPPSRQVIGAPQTSSPHFFSILLIFAKIDEKLGEMPVSSIPSTYSHLLEMGLSEYILVYSSLYSICTILSHFKLHFFTLTGRYFTRQPSRFLTPILLWILCKSIFSNTH